MMRKKAQKAIRHYRPIVTVISMISEVAALQEKKWGQTIAWGINSGWLTPRADVISIRYKVSIYISEENG